MADEKLSEDKLQTAQAVLTLGLIVVRELSERGVATIFINNKGETELVPPGEVELDGMSQEDALDELLRRGYEDDQLTAYVLGRMARKTRSNG